MKRFVLDIITILLAADPGFSQTKKPSPVADAASERLTEAKRAIDKGNAEWIEAWEKGNPEMLVAIFTDDGVMLSQGGKVFKGRQQILERQKEAMESVTRPIKVSVVTVKIWLNGDKPIKEEGRYVTMWKRQDDGSWKLSMDMAVPEN
jgi:ketosteroid isomerase-like protein